MKSSHVTLFFSLMANRATICGTHTLRVREMTASMILMIDQSSEGVSPVLAVVMYEVHALVHPLHPEHMSMIENIGK